VFFLLLFLTLIRYFLRNKRVLFGYSDVYKINCIHRDTTSRLVCNVDTTCCPIEKPQGAGPGNDPYYCVKCKDHVLKYDIAVHSKTGRIVRVHGGTPGATHDLTIARQGLIPLLVPHELVWADKAYIGEPCFVTPRKGKWRNLSPEERKWNKIHSQHHFCHIERLNRRLKVWMAFRVPWRHDLSDHPLAFLTMCCRIHVNGVRGRTIFVLGCVFGVKLYKGCSHGITLTLCTLAQQCKIVNVDLLVHPLNS
jgi:hypothetical protein